MSAHRRSGAALAAAALALVLAGCGERNQSSADKSGIRKSDTQAWAGVQGESAAFTTSGWKSGDKTAWEAQLKARTERGQNEYTRVAPKAQ